MSNYYCRPNTKNLLEHRINDWIIRLNYLDISINKLSKICGCDQHTLSDILRHRQKNPRVSTLGLIESTITKLENEMNTDIKSVLGELFKYIDELHNLRDGINSEDDKQDFDKAVAKELTDMLVKTTQNKGENNE